MKLLSLLPTFNMLGDLTNYWHQMRQKQKLTPMIEKLLHKGLITREVGSGAA
jgi:hypothetical protein